MSIFSDRALPEVSLEELIQLRLAMGLYVEVLKTDKNLRVQREVVPLVNRMHEEIMEEVAKRWAGLELV